MNRVYGVARTRCGPLPLRAAMPPVFTRYQKFVVAVLAFLQFTIILDFMIISPLGALLLRDLHITTRQFGLVVSAYAFSAGASGLLAAGFADKFDRKRLLLFFYAGFLLGHVAVRRGDQLPRSCSARASSRACSAASSARSAWRSSPTCSRSRCAAG